MSKSCYLEFVNITKRFPGVKALDDLSFSVDEGSVHAIVGENGAGKSTLLKILGGHHIPTNGLIRIAGTTREFKSSADSLGQGIAIIHQELQLVSSMSVAENIFLGNLPARFGIVRKKKLLADTLHQLNMLEEKIDPQEKLGNLSIAERQMIEIAKALSRGAKVIAFDEPTSSLSDREVQKLFGVIRDLKQQNRVIIYVSHRMDEIFEMCDAITVLRDGRHIKTYTDTSNLNHDMLVKDMVGREIKDIYSYTPRTLGQGALKVTGLTSKELKQPSSLNVRSGEIVGIFGLVGAGRSELLETIYGSRKRTAGAISLNGHDLDIRSPIDAITNGIMLCPEDRKKDGIIAVRSVQENINLSARRNHLKYGFKIRDDWENKNAKRMVKKLAVKTPSLAQLVVNLSGGNQQKVILARWLSEKVKVMLLDEPTRGIDIGAKNEIYSIIYDLAKSGVGIVLVSADLPEVLGVSDRILVMRGGAIVAALDRSEADEEKILKLALPVQNN